MEYFELKLHRHILGTPEIYITSFKRRHNRSLLICLWNALNSSQAQLYSAVFLTHPDICFTSFMQSLTLKTVTCRPDWWYQLPNTWNTEL